MALNRTQQSVQGQGNVRETLGSEGISLPYSSKYGSQVPVWSPLMDSLSEAKKHIKTLKKQNLCKYTLSLQNTHGHNI